MRVSLAAPTWPGGVPAPARQRGHNLRPAASSAAATGDRGPAARPAWNDAAAATAVSGHGGHGHASSGHPAAAPGHGAPTGRGGLPSRAGISSGNLML